ncbi:MAG: glutathione S-transferase [Ketobacter sp.]|nr:glutathione S-transferase [Ketobacter sp.]
MSELTIWTLDWVPELPRGFVRDIRLRWACEEAEIPYRVETIPFDDRETNHLAQQPFGQVPFLRDGALSLFESGACLLQLENVLSGQEWLAADRFTVADLLMADVLRLPDIRAFGNRSAAGLGGRVPSYHQSIQPPLNA